MKAQLALLLFGSLAFWLACAVPAWLLAGPDALLHTGVALALCLVPVIGTLVWCHWALAGSPEDQLMAVMGGTGIRLVVAIAGGIALFQTIEALHRRAFLVWVVVFYLATLTLEIVVVLRRQQALANERGKPLQPPHQ